MPYRFWFDILEGHLPSTYPSNRPTQYWHSSETLTVSMIVLKYVWVVQAGKEMAMLLALYVMMMGKWLKRGGTTATLAFLTILAATSPIQHSIVHHVARCGVPALENATKGSKI